MKKCVKGAIQVLYNAFGWVGGSGHLLLCVIRVGGYLCDLLYNKCFFGNFRFAPPPRSRGILEGKNGTWGPKSRKMLGGTKPTVI